MTKGKSVTLLTIIGIIMAALIVFTFIPFPIGVKDFNAVVGAIDADYDIAGGSSYTLTLSEDNQEEVEDIEALKDTIKTRLYALDYNVFSVKAIKSDDEGVKDYQIVIETETRSSLASDIEAVVAYGDLHFYGGTSADDLTEILEDVDAIESAKYTGATDYDGTAYYGLSVTFSKEGREALEEIMGSSSYYLRITLDDKDNDNAKNIISDSSNEGLQITGSSSSNYYSDGVITLYSSDEAGIKQNVMYFNNGGLDYIYEIGEEEEVNAPLGDNIVLISAIAGCAIIAVAVVVMFALYKGFGLVSLLCLALFSMLELIMLVAVPGIKVSLGSIVGIIASLAVTIAGLFITISNIKAENKSGKIAKVAFNYGYRKSLKPIIIYTVVSLVLAIVLFIFTKGLVKSYAITFGIGIALSAITTLLFTRMFTSLFFPLLSANKDGTGTDKTGSFYGLKENKN